MSANLRAFLLLIRWCEGTSGEDGYRTMVGGRKFDDFRDHPRQMFSGIFSNGTRWRSSAAGAFQFLAGTWDEAKAALNLPDFSPASQDQAAIWLIRRRGALEDVEAGRLTEALRKCSPEWASLPFASYGQPTKSYDSCEKIYLAAGGSLSQAAGAAEASPVPAATPSPPAAAPPAPDVEFPGLEGGLPPAPPPRQGVAMPIPAIVSAAASALLPLVSDMMRARGSKTAERNAGVIDAAAPVLIEIAKQVAPVATNEQEAAEAILADKKLQQRFRAEVALRWADVAPAFEHDAAEREAARVFADKMTGDGPAWRQIGFGALIGIMSLTIIVGGGAMFWNLMSSPQLDPGQKGLILGALIASFTTVVGYFFGSSASSRVKDQTISEQARKG